MTDEEELLFRRKCQARADVILASRDAELPALQRAMDALAATARLAAAEGSAEVAQAEIERLNTLVVRLRQEAQVWAMEARGHKSSLHEAYQACTGAKGEPGNWNGAKPIIDALAAEPVTSRKLRELLCQAFTLGMKWGGHEEKDDLEPLDSFLDRLTSTRDASDGEQKA